MELTIRIGGEAGQGLQLIGGLLTRFLARQGYEVFTHQDYMSRIRGGHNFYQIRLADRPISGSRERVDILVALDRTTIDNHRHSLAEDGVVIYDAEMCGGEMPGREFLKVPFTGITEKLEIAAIMANSVAVGAVLGLLNLDLAPLGELFGEFIHRKTEEVIATNVKAAQAGRDLIGREFPERLGQQLSPSPGRKLLLINGSEAIGLGALVSGCRFFAAYPMTPSTGIMNYLAGQAGKHGLVIEQAEDEIAAINMAIGASFGGVRAMTATSGGGFALMTEGLALAAMTETPLVIVEAQRPGPATGLPTRTEQGDLNFVLHGGHGEFPRVVFAPGTPEQAIYLTNKAFHLAEKYQIQAIVLSDQYLADCQWTFSDFDRERMQYEDFRLRGPALAKLETYQRYAASPSGVSPLAVPGASPHLVVADSDEHDRDGHIIEDAETRNEMVRKRLFRKLPLLRQEIAPPTLEGHPEPEVLLVGFGSTYGVMREAIAELSGRLAIALLHFSEVCPFPPPEKFDYPKLLRRSRRVICVENNATGQFARLLKAEIGFDCPLRINKYDGRPFTIEGLLGEINDHLG
jgi:2-oxoglutarate ferredoxin oxidoreductase subunit alpha